MRHRLYLRTGWYRRFCALLIVLGFGASALVAQSVTGDLPFSIQRVVAPPQRLVKELEKFPQGTLHAMPLEEFDGRVQRLRQSLQAREQKPRLLRSHYSAELSERMLVNGSGQWVIANPGLKDSILAIESLNLAAPRSKMRWEQGGEVVLGELDGESLGLLLPDTGNQTFLFDWSLRGTTTDEGLSFQLRIPSCPVTILELTLPVDLWLAIPKKDREKDNAPIVMGPLETEQPGKRAWKIQVTGQTLLELALRKVADPKSAAPTIFAQLQTTQELGLDRVKLDYEFNIDILHGSVRELVLEGNAALEPYDVLLKSGEVQTWHWRAAPSIVKEPPKKDPKSKVSSTPTKLLTIIFREPVQGRLTGLKVRGLALPAQGKVWTSPALRIRDALSRGEMLKIQWHPELHIRKWDSGSFQLIGTATELGVQSVTLANPTFDPAAGPRPTLILGPHASTLHTQETTRWHLDSHGATLSAEWNFSLLRGNLYQVAIKLPVKEEKYRLEAVDVQPAELLRRWYPAGDLLVVELKQPLTPTKKVNLKMRLRASFPEITSGGRIVSYPRLEPVAAVSHSGTVAISIERIFQPQLVESSIPLTRIPEAPAGQSPERVGYLFTLRNQRLTTSLRLIPQPVQVRLRGKQTVVLSDAGAVVQYRWEAEPLLGAPEYLDFRLPEGVLSSLSIKADDEAMRIHRWERMHLAETLPHLLHLGAQHGLDAALLKEALPTEPLWRFHLAQPLRKKAHFTLEGTLPGGIPLDDWQRVALSLPTVQPLHWIGANLASELLPREPGKKIWSIPRMVPAQRLNVDQEIHIESAQKPIVQAMAPGLRRVTGTPVEPAGPVHSLLFQGDNVSVGSKADVSLWTQPIKASSHTGELCDEARLTTIVCGNGQLSHHVQFRLWHWRERFCTVRFSPGVQVAAARMQNQWLDRVEVSEQQDGVRVVLPIDQNTPFVRCEIVLNGSTGSTHVPAMARVPIPQIDWPLKPLDFRFRYVLAGGWVPLQQERMIAVGLPGGMPAETTTLNTLRRVWSWGQSWFPQSARPGKAEDLDTQKQTILNGEAQLRTATKKDITLAEVLERLSQHCARDEVPLVVDRLALRGLGLSPASVLTPAAMTSTTMRPAAPIVNRPFWEALGLVYVPLSTGALLTSPARAEALALSQPTALRAVEGALHEAMLHGRDASAGFMLAVVWARTSGSSSPGSGESWNSPGLAANDMTEWIILPGPSAIESILIVDSTRMRLLGWLFATLLALVVWRIHCYPRVIAGLRAHVILGTASIFLALWLPACLFELLLVPMLLVLGIGFLFFLWSFASRDVTAEGSTHSTVIKPAVPATVLGLLVLAVPWVVTAQPLDSGRGRPPVRTYTVYIVDGPKPTAFVPVELKTKLEEDENQPHPSMRSAILVGARYLGKVKDQTATFEGQFDVYCSTEDANLIIPLTGVQLQDGALLDGTRALPTLHKSGYQLKIRGKGIHHLKLPFTARVLPAAEGFELAFNCPRLPASEMSLQWATPVQSVLSLKGWGEEKTVAVPTAPLIKEWHAQLGYENVVQVRWSTSAAFPKSIDIKEMHFWDLRPGTFSLLSSFSYSLGKGSVAQLVVAMPEGLHVRTVEVGHAAAPAASANVPIKHWQIIGKAGQRRLVIELMQPIANQLLLNLEIVPQLTSRGHEWMLPLPAAMQGKAGRGFVGYRLDATELETKAPNLSVQGVAADDFVRVWSKQTSLKIPLPSRAYSFERRGAPARLEPKMQPTHRLAHMDFTWNLDIQQATLSGKTTLSSPHEDIIVQEFLVPEAFALSRVLGPDVSHWNLDGNRLQVWLRRACKQTELEIVGWQRLEDVRAGVRRFTLPGIAPLQVQRATGTVQLRSAPRLHIQPERLQRLRPVADDGGGRPRDPHRYAMDDLSYTGSFLLQEKATIPEAYALTRIQRTERGVELWCGIRLLTDRGQLPVLKLHLHDWPEEAVHLEAPAARVTRLKNPALAHPVWSIKFDAGLPHETYLIVRTNLPEEQLPGLALPTLELENIPLKEPRWIAWKDLELTDRTGRRIADNMSLAERAAGLFQDYAPGKSASWKHARLNSPLRAELPRTTARPQVRVLSATHSWHLDDQPRWLHKSQYWVQVQERSTVRIRFPAELEQCVAFLDDRLLVSLNVAAGANGPTGREYMLSLPPNPYPQMVRLCWTYSPGTGNLHEPNLELPVWEQTLLPPQQRLVWVPAGMKRVAQDEGERATLIARLAQQADTHMRLSVVLAQEPARLGDDRPVHIVQQQKLFQQAIRQGESLLPMLVKLKSLADWSDRFKELVKENRKQAQEHGYIKQRLAAEKSRAPLLNSTDIPEGELSMPSLMAPETTTLTLMSGATQSLQQARTRSELVSLVAIALLVLSYIRRAMTIIRGLVPEIVLTLTASSLWLFGWSLIGLMIVLAMLSLRGVWIGRVLSERLQGWSKPVSEPLPPSVPPASS